MDESTKNLDLEYKRYLQIMRPYLGQLDDEDAINICNAWIKRLSNSSEQEKPMRNRYVFVLCYQLAKGVIDVPFLQCPPVQELPPISEEIDSESSTEDLVYDIDLEDDNTRVLFNNKKPLASNTECLSQDHDCDKYGESSKDFDSKTFDEKSSGATRRQTVLCYTCPQMMKACAEELADDQYEYRANNLIIRLREIKNQNRLLHNELVSLKEEYKSKPCETHDGLVKIDNATNASQFFSSSTLKSLQNKIQEFEQDKQNLSDTVKSLQEQLDNFHEVKRIEFEDIEKKYKQEIAKIKSSVQEENKIIHDRKLEELKQNYDNFTHEVKQNTEREILGLQKRFKETIAEKEKIIDERNKVVQEKDDEINTKDKVIIEQGKELQEKVIMLREKDRVLEEITKTLQAKNTELASLKSQVEDQNRNIQTILNKLLDKPHGEVSSDSMKMKSHELEKRLIKMEKSKTKCVKMYESKLAYLQREKHLAECSLQLQLVRQRAQVINETADESQTELAAALDKLEAKYKDIVANVQSTAIQRRIQDQLALDSIFQAACGLRNENIMTNPSQFSGKTVTVRPKEENQSYDSEISGIMRNKIHTNKSIGDKSTAAGFCLDGERFGQLFDKIHIPQRDCDLTHKK